RVDSAGLRVSGSIHTSAPRCPHRSSHRPAPRVSHNMISICRKFAWLFQWRRKEADLLDEVAFHLAEEMEERQNDGISAEDARRSARVQFGSVASVQEDVRTAWWPGPRPPRLLSRRRGGGTRPGSARPPHRRSESVTNGLSLIVAAISGNLPR